MSLPPQILQVALATTVVTAAVYDVRWRRIPNWLVLAGWIAGIGLNTFLESFSGLRSSLAGFAVGFGAYFLLYLLRGMGAGDVKLMGAVGAIVGPANWLAIFVSTALIGGVAAIILLLLRRRLRQSLSNVGYVLYAMAHFRAPYAREELDLSSPKSLKLPHGLMIALGTAIFLGIGWLQAR